jgi:ribonuclease HII
VAGLDEAGRGPLAGPVVAAAVVFESDFLLDHHRTLFGGLTDSKRLSEARREGFFATLTGSPQVSIGVGQAAVEEIDTLNILKATHLAMRRALGQLDPCPGHVLVDGRPVPDLPCSSTAIVGGDRLSLSVAAASVVAKVTRDRMMKALDAEFPEYGFARNKGYGTGAHRAALREHGPCPQHRRSFRPVSQPELGLGV